MSLAESVVVDIVCRSNLQATGTELDVNIAVFDNRDNTVYERNDNLMSAQPLVLRVLRVDTHGSIAHDSLRTCGGNNGIVAAVGILMQNLTLTASRHNRVSIGVSHIVAQIEQMALLVAIDNLLGRKHGLCLRVPVHHTQSAVDESLLIEVDKNLEYALRALLVHSECSAIPVAACSKTAQLLEDDATVLVGPVPSMLKELLASKVALLDALLGEAVYHLSLSSDRSVVGARYPTSVLSLHTCTTHENVLYSIVEHVAHVQHASHVRRRYNDSVGLTSVGLAAEELVVKPVLIPFRLHCLWVVLRC